MLEKYTYTTTLTDVEGWSPGGEEWSYEPELEVIRPITPELFNVICVVCNKKYEDETFFKTWTQVSPDKYWNFPPYYYKEKIHKDAKIMGFFCSPNCSLAWFKENINYYD